MSAPLRVVHYVNQFFAGVGGEEHADVGVSVKVGAVGPASRRRSSAATISRATARTKRRARSPPSSTG
jgi:hypothetical protein